VPGSVCAYQAHCLRFAREGFPSLHISAMYDCTQLHLMHILASSLQVWCDGCGIPPPRTWVRCSLTMHTGLAERELPYLQLASTLLACCCPLWVSPLSQPMSWRYLPSTSPALCRNSKAADAAHIILPCLPLLNPLFTDVQGLIYRHCAF
jgi:hypothetical protein